MSYTKQNFNAGDVLKAAQLNAMDEQILANEIALEGKQEKGDYLTSADLNSKQDVIGDLDDIRQGAAKGATALQSYTEQYKGTVTGVKVNGTTKNPSNGVVDLGTVITSHQDISGKQDTLVSGTNIKTINGNSLLGKGNIAIETVINNTAGNLSFNVIPKPVESTFYNGKKIAMIGDSITAGVGAGDNSKRYTTVLAGLLGATEVNLGASGTVLCTGGHRGCNIGKLTAANINGCSVVTIMMGINDWDQAKANYYKLGEYGSTDTTTIYGAVDMWCKRIVELRETSDFENTKFFFVTPIVTSWNNSVGGSNWDQNKTNIHGFKLRDLCQAIINVCADYKIPVLDMNKYSGIYYNSSSDNTTSTYFGDGIHPNAAGHGQMANALRDYLLENPTYVETSEALNYVLQSLLGETNKISYPNFDNVETFSLELENITLSPSALSLVEGETQNITATLTPSNTTQTSLKWESSDTNVAIVNNGVVTALAEGSVTITCKSIDNPSISATATVVVSKAESTDITGLLISESTKTVTQGETATLSVSYVPSSTTQTGVVWSSDDETVATVVGNGDSCTVTAVGEGQCNIIATSTINSSIKTSCFFTTSNVEIDIPTDIDTLDAANYTLGSNVRFNSETGEISGTASGETLRNTANAATFNVPLKAGMEVEVQHTFPSSYGNYLGFGVDTTTDPSQIELGAGFPRGKFIVYYDVPSKTDDIETWDTATGPHAKLFTDVGTNVSPRIATIGRDVNGKLYVKHNGTTLTDLPDYTCIETANNSENLYVWFGGCDNKATWKINYFGESRSTSTEPDVPAEPEIPSEPDTPDSGTWTLGNNVSISEDGLISSSGTGITLQSVDNLAIYNTPLLPGMEVEIVNEKVGNSIDSNFILCGVDTTNNLDEITKSGSFTIGKFNIYYDSTKAPVKSILGSTSNQFNLLDTGANTSPRTAIIRRDANGTIKVIYNGTETKLPTTYSGYTTCNSTEQLYVFIGGISNQSNWKMTYFGESRDTSSETPTDPETPTEPTNELYTLGANVTYNSEDNTLKGTQATSYGNENAVAVYNQPLKPGMEVEIVAEFGDTAAEFAAIGVDTTNNISDINGIPSGTKKYQNGILNVYFDNPRTYKNVQYIMPKAATLSKSVLCTEQNNVSPRTTIIKRDENGVITGTCNGVTLNFPDNEHTTLANNTEDLYVFIAGIGTQITWKFNYFGELRG